LPLVDRPSLVDCGLRAAKIGDLPVCHQPLAATTSTFPSNFKIEITYLNKSFPTTVSPYSSERFFVIHKYPGRYWFGFIIPRPLVDSATASSFVSAFVTAVLIAVLPSATLTIAASIFAGEAFLPLEATSAL
jgi:hypothetical protein